MSRDQRAVQSSAWRRRVEGLTCARQVQRKTGERLPGLYWQFGHIHLQLLGSARTVNSVVVVPTSTDPMGILKSTREFKAPGAGKEHTSAVRGDSRDPSVRRPGSGRPTVRSKFFRVCCFVLLNRYWGIVTVPGSIPYGCRPGVAGSSPSTLTTSLAIPVPSSSSSNGPTTVPLTTMGLCHGGSVVWAGLKFVRPHC